MSLPVFPELKPVGLEDKAVFDAYLEGDPSDVCELVFANIYMWKDSEHPRWTTHNGSLCVLVEPDFEPPYFLPPVGGERVPETVAALLAHAPRLSRVPEDFAARYGSGFRSRRTGATSTTSTPGRSWPSSRARSTTASATASGSSRRRAPTNTTP